MPTMAGALASPADVMAAEVRMPDELERLRERLREAPNETLLDAPAILGSRPTVDEAMQLIDDAEAALRSEPQTVVAIEAAVAFDEPYELPPQYQFPGYDPVAIPITPNVHKFEEKADWYGWAVTGAAAWIWRRANEKPPFPRHSEQNPFIYPLQSAGPLQVALFSDAANGYYHSRYITKHITMIKPAAAIHLGDVYYTGRRFEVEDYLEEPLKDLLPAIPCFVLNANHEMDSYGVHYFDYVRRKQSPVQPQEGSYFCLQAERYQIIGIDTAFFKNGRHPDAQCQAWLADRLAAGRASGRINILLSQNEPYHKKSKDVMPLVQDLKDVKDQIDIWFWGDEHYAALYGPGPQTPFIGSCIGHAGYPYETLEEGGADNEVAPTWWEENGTRFPEELGVRLDMGLNGWCLLDLGDDALTLTYYDWLQRPPRNTQRLRIEQGRLVRE